jgi:hypothetical protein
VVGVELAAEWLMLRADRSRLRSTRIKGLDLARSRIGRRAVLDDRVEVTWATLQRASAADHVFGVAGARPAAVATK